MIARILRIEAAAALILAWAMIFLLPFRWVARLIGPAAAPTASGVAPDPAALTRARVAAARLRAVERRLPLTCTCLVLALAGAMLLARRGIGPAAIHFGVRRVEGRLSAHAWLTLGNVVLLGADEAGAFQPLAVLGGRGCVEGTGSQA